MRGDKGYASAGLVLDHAPLMAVQVALSSQVASATDPLALSMTVVAEAADKSWTILREEPAGKIVLLLLQADRANGAGLKNPHADPPEPIRYPDAPLRAAQQAIILQDLETRVLVEVRRITGNSTVPIDDPSVTASILRTAQRRATDTFVYDHAGVPLAAAMGLHSPLVLYAAELNHPGFGLVLDSFHIFARGHPLAPIARIPKEQIFLVQISDAPQLDLGYLDWSRHYRTLPGRGSFDLAEFTRCVRAAGYDGIVSLECFSDDLRSGPAHEIAASGHRAMLSLWHSKTATE